MSLNLKKAAKKGNLATIIVTIVLLIVSGYHIYKLLDTLDYGKSAERLYKEGKIYDSSKSYREDQAVAILVTDVMEGAEDNATYWDEYIIEHDGVYSFLYAYQDDSIIHNLMERQGTLQEDPEYLRVVVAKWDDEAKESIQNLNEELEADVLLDSSYSLTLNEDYFAFRVEERNRYVFMGGASFLAAMVSLLLMIFNLRKSKKSYRNLLSEYPELEDGEDVILSNGYYDDKLKIAVYKNHVISLANRMMAVDLREIKSYNTYIQNSYYYGIRTGQNFFINFIMKSNKSMKLPMKRYRKETEGRLNEVYAVISRRLSNLYEFDSGGDRNVPQNQAPFSGYKPTQEG